MTKLSAAIVILVLLFNSSLTATTTNDYKAQVVKDIAGMSKQAQVMVDMVFSFAELGFQEVETSKYLTGVLEKEGFKIERGIAGIATAWIATYGSGKPVIALGSDVDCIPQASQKPGVAYHDPLIEGAPGHGEGHAAQRRGRGRSRQAEGLLAADGRPDLQLWGAWLSGN